MSDRKNCMGRWQRHVWEDVAGRQKCTRCAKLNPLGVPPYIRFWDHVQIGDGCWIWTGAKSRDGYGLFTVVGFGPFRRTVQAHKYAWMLLRGHDAPDGQEFDHNCHQRACVNPDHIRTVPHLLNIHSKRTANKCKKGHLLYEANLTMRTGVRRCLLCHVGLLAVVS